MMNQTKRSKAKNVEYSDTFCDWLFTHVSGRAHIPTDGEIVGFDSKRKEVFIKRQGGEAIWMPGGAFLKNLAREEIALLENLPHWDGGNESSLSRALVSMVTRAYKRYHQLEFRASSDPDNVNYFNGASQFTETIIDECVVRRGTY